MGSSTGFQCNTCGERFMVSQGGGFFFDLLCCDACGGSESVSHEELGDIHLGFVKGLPGPYAVARSAMDARIKAEHRGSVLTRAEYHAAAEATLEPCECGGRFRYGAPPRCSKCRSTPDQWRADPSMGGLLYD